MSPTTTASGLLRIAGGAAEVIPGLPAVVETLQFVLERVELVRENKKQHQAFREEVEKINNILRNTTSEAEKHVPEYGSGEHGKDGLVRQLEKSNELQTHKTELESTVEDLRSQAQRLKGGKGLCGLIKGFIYASRNAAILSEMNTKLREAVGHFQLFSNIAVHSMVQGIEKLLQEANDKAAIALIPWAPAGYRSVDDLKSGFLPGTRDALFREIDLWLANGLPEGRGKLIYLLTGGVGLGKSSISHQLCKRVDSGEDRTLVLGASFFFVRGGGNLESTRLFFSTLARQLVASRPDLRPSIVKAAETHAQHGEQQQMRYSYEELIRQPLREAAQQVPQLRTLLVVDGIDECRDRDLIPSLLQHLLALVGEFPWLYVFLTSRPERHALEVLASKGAADIVHRRQLDESLLNSRDDIKRYFEDEMSRIPVYDGYFKSHPCDLGRLLDRTGDMFIFARLAVNYLKNHQNRPEEQVEHVLSDEGAAALALDSLYLQVLRSAQPPNDISTRERDRLQSFLRFLTLSNGLMTPSMMSFLDQGLSGDGDVDELVQSLGSVIKVQKDIGAIAPLHDSFIEFLLNEERCTEPTYCVDAPRGHALLASACLEVFTFANFTNRLASYRTPDKVQHRTSLQYAIPGGFLHHLEHAESDDRLEKELVQFVSGEKAAMYLWVMGDARRLAHCLWRCLKRSSAKESTCAELVKFSAYIKRWRSDSSGEPRQNLHISVEAVSAYLCATYSSDAVMRGLDLSVRSEDLSRYQAIMVQLEQDINQDHRAQLIWYDQPALNDVTFSTW